MPKEDEGSDQTGVGLSELTVFDQARIKGRMEKMLLRGITSTDEMAAAFGISGLAAVSLKTQILERWRTESNPDVTAARIYRTKQLEGILQLAINAFDRSRVDVETFTQDINTCPTCKGDKKVEDKPDEWVDCPTCRGIGKIVVQERVSVKGSVGDPAFLSIGIQAIKEIGRLDGTNCGKPTSTVLANTIVNYGTSQPNPVIDATRDYYTEALDTAPHDTLLAAKKVLEDMKRLADGRRKGNKSGGVIVVKPNDVEKKEEQE